MQNNKPDRRVYWTKEQREARQEEMEELHPGYLDMQLKLNVVLGAALFARGFYHALSIMLEQEPFTYIILAPLNLIVGYFLYRYCMQAKWLARLLLASRLIEFGRSLWPTFRYVFYLNFIGTVWWVTLVVCFLVDIGFLWLLTLSKKGKQQVEYNRIINSGQVINLGRAAQGYFTEGTSGYASETSVWYPGQDRDEKEDKEQ